LTARGRVLAILLVPVFAWVSPRLRAETPECRTFSSSGSDTIAVDGSYDGYYVVAFGAKDDPTDDSLSVIAARESPDGGSDIRRTYSHGDLPVELPRGTVRGFTFALTGTRPSSDFWVTLAVSPEGCPPERGH
jgi:hypothetical protein